MLGEKWKVAFTFAVRADGSWFDPKAATGDGDR